MMIAALIQKVDAAQTCHNSLTDRQWLQPLSGRWYVIAVIIATSIAAYMNYYVSILQGNKSCSFNKMDIHTY